MDNSKYRTLGYGLIFIGVALGAIWLLWSSPVTTWLARHVSRDGAITEAGRRELSSALYAGVALMLVVGVGAVRGDTDWRRRLGQAILVDPIFDDTRKASLPRRMLIVSTLGGVVLLLAILLTYRLFGASSGVFRVLYLEDGVLESLTPVLFLLACLMLVYTAVRLLKVAQGGKMGRIAATALIILAVFAFLYAMEEISWGQRIFGWSTPEAIAEHNTQDETNIHNYFTGSFDVIYRLLAAFPLVALLPLWLEVSRRSSILSRLLLPHPSMLGLVLVIGLVALVWYREQELLEEMLALFVACYSLRLYFWARDSHATARGGQLLRALGREAR